MDYVWDCLREQGLDKLLSTTQSMFNVFFNFFFIFYVSLLCIVSINHSMAVCGESIAFLIVMLCRPTF